MRMKRKKAVIAGIMMIFLAVVVLTAVCGNSNSIHLISDKGEKNKHYKEQEIVKTLGAVGGEKEDKTCQFRTGWVSPFNFRTECSRCFLRVYSVRKYTRSRLVRRAVRPCF